jgi:hypothetical protein
MLRRALLKEGKAARPHSISHKMQLATRGRGGPLLRMR